MLLFLFSSLECHRDVKLLCSLFERLMPAFAYPNLFSLIKIWFMIQNFLPKKLLFYKILLLWTMEYKCKSFMDNKEKNHCNCDIYYRLSCKWTEVIIYILIRMIAYSNIKLILYLFLLIEKKWRRRTILQLRFVSDFLNYFGMNYVYYYLAILCELKSNFCMD